MGLIDHQGSIVEFGVDAAEVLEADDVGYVVSGFLRYRSRVFYPAGALAGAQIARVWLGVGRVEVGGVMDLIFRMPPFEDQPPDFSIYEIVLRTGHGAAYGGWAFGNGLRLLNDYRAGHRILATSFRGSTLSFAYEPTEGSYRYVEGPLSSLSTAEIRVLAKSRQRA